MADLNKIIKELSSLTVLEAAELSKLLEEKWGVSAAASVAVASVATGDASGGEAEEEKDSFEVVLAEIGSNKIGVIKEVRAVAGLSLGDAKALVESAPKAIKSDVSKEEAESLKKKLEATGAKVELK